MANNSEIDFKELFLAEALEGFDDISQLLVKLEAKPNDEALLAEIFRLLHNLKANSRASGYEGISHLSHTLEHLFSSLRDGKLKFQGKLIILLFDGIDLLGEWLRQIDNAAFAPPKELLVHLDAATANTTQEAIEALDISKQLQRQDLALSDLIYIPVRRLDNLMNLVGELIIDRDRIQAVANNREDPALRAIASHLHRVTSDLQMSVMDARLVSIGSLFNKFPRIVRDVSQTESKEIELKIAGQEIKIDRNILQLISDSLLHLVRNAVTHGIEDEKTRVAAGKPPHGVLKLDASSVRDTVLIEVSDDGRGIDPEKIRATAIANNWMPHDKLREMNGEELQMLLFEPGFSLSSEVTEISGRGVGLDVVKTSLDAIGGRLTVESEVGKGTRFIMILPTSIAVKGSLLLEVDATVYAIPLVHIDSVVTLPMGDLHSVGLSGYVADIRGEMAQVVYMSDLFRQPRTIDLTQPHFDVVVVAYATRKIGLIVDKLIRQQDIVVKPLQKPVDGVELFGGVTLLGHGEVCFLIDVPAVFRMLSRNQMEQVGSSVG